MVLRPLLGLALVGAGLAQQCICDADDTKGYWTGFGNCTACDTVSAPLDLNIIPAGGPQCNLKDRCRDVSIPLVQRSCYGVGLCLNSITQPCNCSYYGNTNLAGTHCERCVDGWTNWPNCNTPKCVEPLVNSGTCNNHGTCSDQAARLACGVTGTNCESSNLDVQSPVCQPVSYNPVTQMCQSLGDGRMMAAFQPGPGESLCGGTRCTFGYTCANPDPNPARAVCCQKDMTPCHARSTAANPATVCCHPTEVCCEGTCCSSSQKCAAIVRRSYVVTSGQVNTRFGAGGSYVLVPGQPGYSGAFGGGPWSDWKMQDGSEVEPWKVCQSEFLGAVATTRVVILPIGLTVATILSLLVVWQAAGLNPLSVAIPAIGIIACAIFVYFSIFWVVGVVISLASLMAIGAGHKGGTAFLVAIVAELFALAVVCGGLGLGSLFYDDNYNELFFDLGGGASSAHSTSWDALAACSRYYDYFFVDTSNVPFDADPNLRYRDYCSEGWYAYLGLVADIIVSLQILMLATTGVAYLKGGSSASGKNLN